MSYLFGKKSEEVAHFNEVENNVKEVGVIYRDMVLIQLLDSKAKLLGLDAFSADLKRLESSFPTSVLTTSAESELYDWKRNNAQLLNRHAKNVTELDEEVGMSAHKHLKRLYQRDTEKHDLKLTD
jgi:hypothetical protein